MRLVRLGFLVLALAFCAGRLAAADEPPAFGPLAGTVQVPEKLTSGEVQQAVVIAALGRGWSVREKSDSKIVLFLEQRGWRSTLTLLLSPTEVNIYSDSGKTDSTGKIKKPEIPEGWVKYLKQDITKQFGLKLYVK